VAVAASAGRVIWAPHAGQRPHIRTYAFRAFVLVAVLPVLLLSAVNGQLFETKQVNEGADRQREAVTALRNHIDEYVTTHIRAVQALASAGGELGDDHIARQRLLEHYQAIYEGFITIFLARTNGFVSELVPPMEPGSAAQEIGDRQYFIDALSTGRLAVSDVI